MARHFHGAGLWVFVLAVAVGGAAAEPFPGDAARGAELFALAGGCGCHTSEDGAVGAGGGEVPTPFGTFYGTNITPDDETGIGRWTDAEIDAALRAGVVRGRGAASPAMPYYRYAGMADADVADLIAYLRSLPPVRRENRPHDVSIPMPRLAYRAWRAVFASTRPAPRLAPTATLQRGRYLADHVAICGDCHTPRHALGAEDASLYLAGTEDGPEGVSVPNITTHASGIAGWDQADVEALLTYGMLPNFDNVQGWMAHVVDGRGDGPGYSDAPAAELRAIASYILTVPPIDNEIR